MPPSPDAATVLRDARRRAGLAQVELAARAGVSQSVISAYESGARQPSVPMLRRLVSAAGFELELGLRRRPGTTLAGPLGRRVWRHRAALRRAAAARGVSNLRVFGSVARGQETAGSDVDLLVDVAPDVGLLALARLTAELEALLGARVDLVPEDGLKAGVRSAVEADLVAL